MELGLEDQRARTIYMKFSKKASFSFTQKFPRRSNKAFGGSFMYFHDLVMSVCCSFLVELKFLYMNYSFDIDLHQLYIYDRNTKDFFFFLVFQ